MQAYLLVYSLAGLCVVMLTGLRALAMTLAGVNAARRLHAAMLHAVLSANLYFFERTPAGRILNRFSRDVTVRG